MVQLGGPDGGCLVHKVMYKADRDRDRPDLSSKMILQADLPLSHLIYFTTITTFLKSYKIYMFNPQHMLTYMKMYNKPAILQY